MLEVLTLKIHIYKNFSSQKYIAFITPWGFYEWVRVLFGLMNAPACFKCFKEQCLHAYQVEFVIPHLNDVLIYFATFDEHLHNLKLVLHRLKQYSIIKISLLGANSSNKRFYI